MHRTANASGLMSSGLTPKPVRPRPAHGHGLLGIPFVRQHMLIDELWTTQAHTEQFKGMTNLLTMNVALKKKETAADRTVYARQNRILRRQVREGRVKLANVLHGDNSREIHNSLNNHKEMQRLYQQMPLERAVENINQRTFVMRKERDRLRYQVKKLKETYKAKLLERADLENRIKQEKECQADEESKAIKILRRIDNSQVRLNAIKTINTSYHRIIQVLQQDAIFHEPILSSLDQDIDDQARFIKHILYLGMPAIAKFTELSEEYRRMEEKERRDMQNKLQMMTTYRKVSRRRTTSKKIKIENAVAKAKRYLRETKSTIFLSNELDALERMIKIIKSATLSSQPTDIFPRIKQQTENNRNMFRIIHTDGLSYEYIDTKMRRANVLQDIILDNLTDQEVARKNRLKELKEQIQEENEREHEMITKIKHLSDKYVLLRFSLLNLNDILRHVDRPAKPGTIKYPNSYLKLPLLRFEMLTLRACPPEPPEDNLDEMMLTVQRKVEKLMKVYKNELDARDVRKCVYEYENAFLDALSSEDYADVDDVERPSEEDFGIEEIKISVHVPNRKQIKAQSARVVEENMRKQD